MCLYFKHDINVINKEYNVLHFNIVKINIIIKTEVDAVRIKGESILKSVTLQGK